MDDDSGESMEPIGNESVPNIIINATISLLFKAAVSILVISHHKSFPVLFDKIASIYLKKYFYILALETASPGNQHCANCIGTLSFRTEEVPFTGLCESELE